MTVPTVTNQKRPKSELVEAIFKTQFYQAKPIEKTWLIHWIRPRPRGWSDTCKQQIRSDELVLSDRAFETGITPNPKFLALTGYKFYK